MPPRKKQKTEHQDKPKGKVQAGSQKKGKGKQVNNDVELQALTAVSRRTRRGIQDYGDKKGLFQVILRKSQAFRFLDLPADIRMLIYRFVFGYRTIHIRYTSQEDRMYRTGDPVACWRYFVCKCDVAAHPDRSEYAMGQIWAGDASDEESMTPAERRRAWRTAIPVCEFDDDKHRACGFSNSGRGGQRLRLREKLHLSLLRTCSLVYNEAKHIPYTENIFAFVSVHALYDFLTGSSAVPGLATMAPAQLASIRNLCIYIQPGGTVMKEWNRTLDKNLYLVDVLKGVRRLQFVVAPQSKIDKGFRHPWEVDADDYWTDIELVGGLLWAFASMSITEIVVDVSLCETKGDEELEEKARLYAKVFESLLLGPNKPALENFGK
ncbi:hypothetical protein BJX64DRAFT_289838 [Aspergillus heterothallicus]